MAEAIQSVSANQLDPAIQAAQKELKTENFKPKEMGRDDFLKLLVTKLSLPQDPMSPMEDTDFIAQMASFSTLSKSNEQIKLLESINQKLDTMSTQQGECVCDDENKASVEKPKGVTVV